MGGMGRPEHAAHRTVQIQSREEAEFMVKQAAKAVPAWQRLKEAWATDRLGVLGSAAATLSGILFSIPRGYFKDFPHAAPQYFTFRHGWC